MIRGLAGWIGVLLLAGCGGRFSLEEVPSDPIAFIHQEPGSISDLEEFVNAVDLLNAEGSGSRQLRSTIALLTVPTNAIQEIPDAGRGAYPLDWSPDGLRLLVGRQQGHRHFQLFEWNRLTGRWDRLKPGISLGSAALGGGPIRTAVVGDPRARTASGRSGIVVEVDREGQTTLTGTDGGREPHVSPDGRHVVFVRRHPKKGREPMIWITEMGATEPRLIGRGNQPRFSRDGEKVVYVTRRQGNADIWLMRVDGSGKRPLVTSGFDDQFPALSPDGRFVVYASARDMGTSQLYMTRLTDRVEVQLTHTGQNGRPVW
jgi:dipeptidyl aminopeptidase/acylaminoacyl peptidase